MWSFAALSIVCTISVLLAESVAQLPITSAIPKQPTRFASIVPGPEATTDETSSAEMTTAEVLRSSFPTSKFVTRPTSPALTTGFRLLPTRHISPTPPNTTATTTTTTRTTTTTTTSTPTIPSATTPRPATRESTDIPKPTTMTPTTTTTTTPTTTTPTTTPTTTAKATTPGPITWPTTTTSTTMPTTTTTTTPTATATTATTATSSTTTTTSPTTTVSSTSTSSPTTTSTTATTLSRQNATTTTTRGSGSPITTTTVTTTTTTTAAHRDETVRVAIACADLFNETVLQSSLNELNAAQTGRRYAQALLPSLADAADVSPSRFIDVAALEVPDNGTLLIEFGLVGGSGGVTDSMQAVANLKRRLLSNNDQQRRRRAVDDSVRSLTSTLDNQTISVVDIFNWTERGLCPTRRCEGDGRCWRRPTGQFYCICSGSAQLDEFCSAPSSPGSSSDCASRADCIFPVIIACVIGSPLVILVIISVVRALRRRRRRNSKAIEMIFSRSSVANPVLELQTIETHSVRAETPPMTPDLISRQRSTDDVEPSHSTDQQQQQQQPKKKKWTRLRYKRSRQHLDPVATDENGFPSVMRDADAESTLSDNSGLPYDRHAIASDEVLSY